jgi:hypothetical protein
MTEDDYCRSTRVTTKLNRFEIIRAEFDGLYTSLRLDSIPLQLNNLLTSHGFFNSSLNGKVTIVAYPQNFDAITYPILAVFLLVSTLFTIILKCCSNHVSSVDVSSS